MKKKNLDSHVTHTGPNDKSMLSRMAGSQSMANNPEVAVHSYRNYAKIAQFRLICM